MSRTRNTRIEGKFGGEKRKNKRPSHFVQDASLVLVSVICFKSALWESIHDRSPVPLVFAYSSDIVEIPFQY